MSTTPNKASTEDEGHKSAVDALQAPVPDPSSAREWLAKMVSYDTTSSKTNIPFIQYLAAYARRALAAEGDSGTGAKVLVEWGPAQEGVSYANLVISLPAFPSAGADAETEGQGDMPEEPTFKGGFILSGHSDVVPVDGQAWDTDPFTLTEKDGRLYGRGTCDMKGYIASFFALLPEWATAMRARRFRKPLHLVLTHSEETDLTGCTQLLREGGEAWRRVQACEGAIIGEPTLMELIIAHKGIAQNSITCRGTAAHSSLQHRSYNAIEPATHVLNFLFGLRDRLQQDGPFEEGFEVPHTTLCPGQVRGGQALNTTPELCTLAYQFRNVPEHTAKDIERAVKTFVLKENKAVQAAVQSINNALAQQQQQQEEGEGEVECPVSASVEVGDALICPAFQGNPQAAVVKALQQAVVSESGGTPTGSVLQKVGFYTEAGEFQLKGLNTVVCGPGSIEQAHKANEFVSVEQLDKAVRVLRRVVEDLCF